MSKQEDVCKLLLHHNKIQAVVYTTIYFTIQEQLANSFLLLAMFSATREQHTCFKCKKLVLCISEIKKKV